MIFLGELPPPRNFATELSFSLGFIALSLIFLQFLITARIQKISENHGIDAVLHLHKLIGYLILGLVLAHILTIFIGNPDFIKLLNPIKMPLKTWMGFLSFFSLIALSILSIFRTRLRINYEFWRISHSLFAILTVSFGGLHVYLVHHYVQLPWKQALWVIYIVSLIFILLFVRLIKPLILAHKPWHVSSLIQENYNTITIELTPIGHKGFSHKPGQFAWIKIDKSPLIMGDHPFSISSIENGRRSLLFTIKEVGDFTKSLKNIPKNSVAYVDGPYGVFSYKNSPTEKAFVFIAGGIGITPIICMLRSLADEKDERSLILMYAARSQKDLIFYDELKRYEQELNLRVIYFLQEGESSEETVVIGKQINQALLLHYLKNILPLSPAFFICGSTIMNKSIKNSLREIGIPLSKIHLEIFNLV